MTLFIGKDNRTTVIPLNRIYTITRVKNEITFTYNSGYPIEKDLNSTAESITINYNEEYFAEEVMRAFYDACHAKEGAFSF